MSNEKRKMRGTSEDAIELNETSAQIVIKALLTFRLKSEVEYTFVI